MNHNDLLLWVSAKASGTWGRFRAAVDELAAPNVIEDGQDMDEGGGDRTELFSLPLHQHVRLTLEGLAHVEFFRPHCQSDWQVVPPTLAGYEGSECANATLCGARSDELINRVVEALGAEVTSLPEAPDRIVVRADSDTELQERSQAAGIPYVSCAARKLLGALPPVDNRQLRREAELPYGDDWEVQRFSAACLAWQASSASDARQSTTGLFRFRIAYQPQYFLRARDHTFRVEVQVGKYLILKRRRRRIVQHDLDRKLLRVPLSCRPPRLIDRALALCSGSPPDVDDGSLVYRNVGSDQARVVNTLLRQI